MTTNNQTIVLGGGCFWCIEAVFNLVKGIISVTSGYAGGTVAQPTYAMVCTGKTGHAEVARVEFDTDVIPLVDVLDIFFHTHDPTSLNRQGADEGTEYRSIVLYTNKEQKKIIEDIIVQLNNSNEFHSKLVTEVKPLDVFYEAENYHKQYYEKNSYQPYCQVVISPKLSHLREKYSKQLKKII